MKANLTAYLAFLLLGILVVPIGSSYAQFYSGDGTNTTATTNMTATNMTETTNMTAASNMTATNMTETNNMNTTVANQTDAFVTQTLTFVDKAISDFAQQKIETVAAIDDCREKEKTASPESLSVTMQECKTNLQSIKDKYQDERNQLSDLIHDYRIGVIVMIKEAKGMTVDPQFKATSLENMKEMWSEKMGYSGNMTMGGTTVHTGTTTVNNTNCVNPPYGPKIC